MLGDSAVLGTGGGGGSSGDAAGASASGGAYHDGGDTVGGGGGSISGDDERGGGSRNEEGGDRNFGGNRWPRQETIALLKIRSEMDVTFRDASVKGPLWDEVSRLVNNFSIFFTLIQCNISYFIHFNSIILIEINYLLFPATIYWDLRFGLFVSICNFFLFHLDLFSWTVEFIIIFILNNWMEVPSSIFLI